MSSIEVKVPAIGDFKDVPVIDILVKPGDTVKVDESLLTLESDKATMDVPSPASGTVRELRVKVGDRVNEGTILLLLESAVASEGRAAALAPPSPPPSDAVAPVSQALPEAAGNGKAAGPPKYQTGGV